MLPRLVWLSTYILAVAGGCGGDHVAIGSGKTGAGGPDTEDLGGPCRPAGEEFDEAGTGQDLSIDVGSAYCHTGICLSHYFLGRVDCPYGNDGKAGQTGRCSAVPGHAALFTLDGLLDGTRCCPSATDRPSTPLPIPVEAQCSGRPAKEAVYCSCRCDVPNDPEIDRSALSFCACGEGMSCVPLCDATHGGCASLPKSRWGSYCVRSGRLGADFDPDRDAAATCGAPLTP